VDLNQFKFHNIDLSNINDIKLRLSMLPKYGWNEKNRSCYMIFAYPNGAKIREGRSGQVISIWPEVCIAMIKEVDYKDGNTKRWEIYPTRRDGMGWYKRPLSQVYAGRESAALVALLHLAEQNDKRKAKGGNKRGTNTTTATLPTPTFSEQLYLAYMTTYDDFSSDTKEIADICNTTLDEARKIGDKLEDAQLIQREKFEQHGGTRVSGRGIEKSREKGKFVSDTWQCSDTYDSITRLAAIDKFIEALPEAASEISDIIAADHTITRKNNLDVYGRLK
jgi:hypothetical protein